jgi:hypothetical protein
LFRIRFFTPAVVNEHGWRHAGGELMVGETRLCFLVDLSHWSTADYMRQWSAGIARLASGQSSTALVTAYRGRGRDAHVIWAFWRDETHVYIQEQSVLPAELDGEFDPSFPYVHVGARVPAAENALPFPEWHVPIEQVHTVLNIRLPGSQG